MLGIPLFSKKIKILFYFNILFIFEICVSKYEQFFFLKKRKELSNDLQHSKTHYHIIKGLKEKERNNKMKHMTNRKKKS